MLWRRIDAEDKEGREVLLDCVKSDRHMPIVAPLMIRLDPRCPELLQRLRAALRSEVVPQVAIASQLLAQMGPAAGAAVPELIPLLKHSNDWVQTAACEALGKIGPGAKDALPALTEVLEGPDAFLRARRRVAIEQIKGIE